jgi:hypothetical protein
MLTLIGVPLLLALSTVFLEFTSIGKHIRAAAGNPDSARLCGISVSRVRLITWGIAGGLSALAAILNGPTTTSFNAEAVGPFLLMLTMGRLPSEPSYRSPSPWWAAGLGLVYCCSGLIGRTLKVRASPWISCKSRWPAWPRKTLTGSGGRTHLGFWGLHFRSFVS